MCIIVSLSTSPGSQQIGIRDTIHNNPSILSLWYEMKRSISTNKESLPIEVQKDKLCNKERYNLKNIKWKNNRGWGTSRRKATKAGHRLKV